MPQVLINWLNLERFFKLGGLVDQIIDTGNRVEFDVDDVLDIFGYEWAELSDDDQNRLGTIVTEFASPHELIIQRTEEKCIILTDWKETAVLQIAKPDMDAICYFIESDNLDGVTQDVTQVDVDDAILRTYGGGFFWSDLSQTEKEDLCNWLEEYVARKGYRLEIKDGHCVIVTN